MIEFSDIPTQPLFLPQSTWHPTWHPAIFADLPSIFCLITHLNGVSGSRRLRIKSFYFSDLILFRLPNFAKEARGRAFTCNPCASSNQANREAFQFDKIGRKGLPSRDFGSSGRIGLLPGNLCRYPADMTAIYFS
jgi:hypothetical protein